ncbi:hypothetical protein [Staphylothermus hellenicus]|uniref:Uncharacterized protein n=1 Tax=Staphylothermus hellenicus (strain DSM 12710 / JCM 10830 / BK20S6-10-b1 / P8) TaxID=591019 RepID=D7D9C8_STAHD|nr:hypothetical protein [Staphylothermus hellenicus]ADI32374.1 hypothetical protein Shell_1279 [Staphylothermus hellenicus DSM 12710]
MYNRALYSLLIIIGIVFYILGALYVYQLASIVLNNTLPLLEAVSSTRIGFRVESINITRENNESIRVSVKVLVNVTWNETAPIKGPEYEVIWKNKTVGKINIESMNKPLINKVLIIKFSINKHDLGEKLYLSVIMDTGIGKIKIVQEAVNVSSLLGQTKLLIEKIQVEKYRGRNYLVFNVSSTSNIVSAPVKIALMDQDGNVLASKVYDDFYVSPNNKYTVSLDITGIDPGSIRYIEFSVYGNRIALFTLGG